jgi:hypothetical protein
MDNDEMKILAFVFLIFAIGVLAQDTQIILGQHVSSRHSLTWAHRGKDITQADCLLIGFDIGSIKHDPENPLPDLTPNNQDIIPVVKQIRWPESYYPNGVDGNNKISDWIDFDADVGESYYFFVRAVESAHSISDWSSKKIFTIAGVPPEAPYNVRVTINIEITQ